MFKIGYIKINNDLSYENIKNKPLSQLPVDTSINIFNIIQITKQKKGIRTFSLFKSNKYPPAINSNNTLESILSKSLAELHNYKASETTYLHTYQKGIRILYSIHLPLIDLYNLKIPDCLITKALVFHKSLIIAKEGIKITN